MAGTSSSMLFESVDGIIYNQAFDHTNSNTVGLSDANTASSRNTFQRFANAASGQLFAGTAAEAIQQDNRNIDIIGNISNADRTRLYVQFRDKIAAPRYGRGQDSTVENNEQYYNYLKGYFGAYLYDNYDWYQTGNDVNFFEALALDLGVALYQTIDAISTTETYYEAMEDYWYQSRGVYAALSETLRVDDALKNTFVKVELYDANIFVYIGIDADGNFRVLADTEVEERMLNSPSYQAPVFGSPNNIDNVSLTAGNINNNLMISSGLFERPTDNGVGSLALTSGIGYNALYSLAYAENTDSNGSIPNGSTFTYTRTNVVGNITVTLNTTMVLEGGSPAWSDTTTITTTAGVYSSFNSSTGEYDNWSVPAFTATGGKTTDFNFTVTPSSTTLTFLSSGENLAV